MLVHGGEEWGQDLLGGVTQGSPHPPREGVRSLNGQIYFINFQHFLDGESTILSDKELPGAGLGPHQLL